MFSIESRAIAYYTVVFVLVALFGFATLYFSSGLPLWSTSERFVDNYVAILDVSNMTLIEKVTYNIQGFMGHGIETHMLYRDWDSPLTLPNTMLDKPHIELVKIICPADSFGYIIDYQGNPTLLEGSSNTFLPPPNPEAHTISKENLAEMAGINVADIEGVHNEAGCTFKTPVSKGLFTVVYVFRLLPPITTDGTYSYTSINLAGNDHLYYKNYTLILKPSNLVEKAYLTPPAKEIRAGEPISLENQLYAIRLDLLLNNQPPGVKSTGDPAKTYSESVSKLYTAKQAGRYTSLGGASLLALIPVIVVLAWYIAGRDKIERPPGMVLEPPKQIKPWQAAALSSINLTPGPRGFVATVLDLIRRNILEYDPETNRVRPVPPDEKMDSGKEKLDFYEKGAIRFIEMYDEQGLFKKKPSRIGRLPLEMRQLVRDLEKLAREEMDKLAQKTGAYKKLIILTILAGLAVIAVGVYTRINAGAPLMTTSMATIIIGILFLVDTFILYLMPTWILGRLKPEYREQLAKLEAYKRFLGNLTSSGPNILPPPQLATMHLTYAVALGFSKKKIKLIAQTLGIVSFLYLYNYVHRYIGRRYWAARSRGSRSGGGGFGGGGAGAR